jgi:hypothetical protein
MRIIVTILVALLPLVCSLDAQSDSSDPDSVNIVSFELKMNSGGRRVIHSWSQKRLVQLGDRVSIALLKILDDTDLKNPATVRDFLPIIRSSFSAPQFVSIESDRKPRVTLLFLEHLQQNIDDAEVRQEIQQTVEFIKAKATKTE